MRLALVFSSFAQLLLASTDSAIPAYLQEGISTFLADSGDAFSPQAELMIALVATGHVGTNLHRHRMQVHGKSFPTLPGPVSHQAKAKVIRPLQEVFDAVESAHKKILRQAQNPMPTMSIINGLAEALGAVNVMAQVCERLAGNPNSAVSGFYREMHAVLARALNLQVYLRSLPRFFNDARIAQLLELDEDDRSFVDQISALVIEGYAAMPGDLDDIFARTEFEKIWVK